MDENDNEQIGAFWIERRKRAWRARGGAGDVTMSFEFIKMAKAKDFLPKRQTDLYFYLYFHDFLQLFLLFFPIVGR